VLLAESEFAIIPTATARSINCDKSTDRLPAGIHAAVHVYALNHLLVWRLWIFAWHLFQFNLMDN